MLHIGFTGTRRGMSVVQHGVLRNMLDTFGHEVRFHHGDCIGADAEAHVLAKSHPTWEIIIHPPIDESKRAFCASDFIQKPAPYLERNFHIVSCSPIMFAAPGEMQEQRRSGTWATVRYAKTIGRSLRIIFPNGTIEESGKWPRAE